MRKNKIISVLLTLAMLFAFALPATATAADTGSIVVKGPHSLTLKSTDFKAYELFTVTTSVSGGETSYAYLPVQPAFDNFMQWVSDNGKTSTYGTTAAEFKTYLEGIADDAPELTALTKDLDDSKAFTAIDADTTVATVGTGADEHNEVTFSGLANGYYLVTGTGTAPGEGAAINTITSHSALVTLESQQDPYVIELKADAPSITKKVWDHNTKTWNEWTDVNISDTVNFQFTSAVPDMTGYSSYTYIVHDKMYDGLKLASDFDENSVEVTIGASSFTDFTVSKIDAQSFDITFGSSFINQHVGDVILIGFSATLDEDAKIAPDSNDNEVWLEYSNNPYNSGSGEDATTGQTPHSRVRVFTYDMKVHKVDGDDATVNLPDAVFNLRKKAGDDSSAIQFKLVTAGDDTAATEYVVVKSGGDTDVTTPESGLIRFIGLDAGTYYLFEKTAPDGYNIMDAETSIVIEPTITLATETAVAQIAYSTVEDTVKNFKGGILPHTGGMGTVLFYVVGTILTVGLVGFFIIRRRRNLLSVK